MEEELKSFIKVCVSAIISVSYCYYIPPKIKIGVPRLLSIIPVCALFYALPLFFTSMEFTFFTLFFLTCFGNIKLILFAFDKGPLFHLSSNLTPFICFTCFPIRRQKNPKTQEPLPTWIFAIKAVTAGVLIYTKNSFPPTMTWFLHPLYVYLILEVTLTLLRMLTTIILGCDLEPHFNQPYLATSLQDFWGRRWNLMVSSTLKSGVYKPVRRVCEPLMSSYHATMMGFLAAFVVSGVSHQFLFFYMNREMPSWNVTMFFVLNGVCTVVEVAVKRTKFGRNWQVSPVVSWLLTMGFLVVTSGLLFIPSVMPPSSVICIPWQARFTGFPEFVIDSMSSLFQ